MQKHNLFFIFSKTYWSMRNSIEYIERNSNRSTCILYHNLTAVTLSACLILIQVKGNDITEIFFKVALNTINQPTLIKRVPPICHLGTYWVSMWFEGWKSSSVLSIVNMIFEFHWKIKNSLIDENSWFVVCKILLN
jgi:hypothetical protein